jgi:hypothetical protein
VVVLVSIAARRRRTEGLFALREGPAPPPRELPAQRLIGSLLTAGNAIDEADRRYPWSRGTAFSLSFLWLAQPGQRVRRSRCHRAGSGASENCRILGALPVTFGEHSNCEGRSIGSSCFPTSLFGVTFSIRKRDRYAPHANAPVVMIELPTPYGPR